VADSGWLAAGSYGANWRRYTGAATIFDPQYRKLPNGLVLLRGLVDKTAALAVPETMFTLPAGYRPGGLAGVIEIHTTHSNAGAAEIRVHSTGVVQLNSGGSASFTSLAGISFLAEN
jgi:hypothetical protein